MNAADALVRYGRQGGRPPPDDEQLVILGDGSFTARRTVAGHRVGAFAGALDGGELDALRSEVAAVAEAPDLVVATPLDGATETTEVGGRSATMGSNERPTGAWDPLVTRMRRLVDAAFDAEAVAGIELEAGPERARLVHIGARPIGVDEASVLIRTVRVDEAGLVLGRWNGSIEPPRVEDAVAPADSGGPRWVDAAEGWSLDLPFRHGLELTPTDWLQVWVYAAIRGHDTRIRAARLYKAVRSGER